MTIVQKHLWISGRVQGVFYRASTQQKAHELAIKGWVKNLPDGRVEAMLIGPEHAIQELIAWCKHGPDRAIVDNIVVKTIHPVDSFSDFEIRHEDA